MLGKSVMLCVSGISANISEYQIFQSPNICIVSALKILYRLGSDKSIDLYILLVYKSIDLYIMLVYKSTDLYILLVYKSTELYIFLVCKSTYRYILLVYQVIFIAFFLYHNALNVSSVYQIDRQIDRQIDKYFNNPRGKLFLSQTPDIHTQINK